MKYRAAMMTAGAALALAGCASSSQYAQQARYAPTNAENDMQYIAAVEAEANRRGVDVYWVHPPQRSVPSDHR